MNSIDLREQTFLQRSHFQMLSTEISSHYPSTMMGKGMFMNCILVLHFFHFHSFHTNMCAPTYTITITIHVIKKGTRTSTPHWSRKKSTSASQQPHGVHTRYQRPEFSTLTINVVLRPPKWTPRTTRIGADEKPFVSRRIGPPALCETEKKEPPEKTMMVGKKSTRKRKFKKSSTYNEKRRKYKMAQITNEGELDRGYVERKTCADFEKASQNEGSN